MPFQKGNILSLKRKKIGMQPKFDSQYIKEQYLAGRTQANIAIELGCNRITILKYLKRLDVPGRHSFFGPNNAMYGKHLSNAHKEKLRLMHKRNIKSIRQKVKSHWTEERKEEYRERLSGIGNPMFGRRLSDEERQKKSEDIKRGFTPEVKAHISKARKGICVGATNPMWKGGYSFNYPYEFEQIRDWIRERDNNTCQICGAVSSNGWQLDVHHIDGDIFNNDPSNLITLCRTCHRAIEGRGKREIYDFAEVR